MSGPRAALALLDDAALEAATSKGLLRRAGRDREAGLARITAEEAERLTLAVDGETVTLGAGGLRAATCTCPAGATCRHILAAILLVRDAPAPETAAAPEPAPDPLAEIVALPAAALVKAFGRAALREAEAILAAADGAPDGIASTVEGRTCTIRLAGQPEVRYLAGLGPEGMISKAPGGRRAKAPSMKALHAAALLALRRLAGAEPAAPEPTAAGATQGAQPEATFLDAVEGALREAARSGLATAPLLLEERLLDLALSSRADALPRLAAGLRGIAEDLSQRRARAASFEAGRALEAIARAYALVCALRGDGADPVLRGAVRQAYEGLSPLDLIGCGVALWRTPTGARGATAHLLHPGPEPRWFTVTLARAGGQDPSFSPRHAARHEPVWGSSLASLGGGWFRLDGARATAHGQLSPGGEARLTPAPAGWAGLFEARPDLFVAEWGRLRPRLAEAFSPSLRAPRGAAPVLLRPRALAPLQFDALEQRAWLPVMDEAGTWLDLTVPVGEADETRLEAVAALQAGDTPALIVALATREGPDLALTPVAALATPDGVLESFDLPTGRKPPPADTLLSRIRRGLAGLGERFGSAEPAFVRAAKPDAATAALRALARDEVLGLAELGGRMEDRPRLDRLARIAARLEAAGLDPLARLLGGLVEAAPEQRPLRLLAFIHAAACDAALNPHPPLVHRVRGA